MLNNGYRLGQVIVLYVAMVIARYSVMAMLGYDVSNDS
jgi:hypothetical protein